MTAQAGAQAIQDEPATDAVVDMSVLAGLMDILPPEQVRELVSILVSDVESRLGRILKTARHDLDDLRREAHDLKSSCGNFGLVEIAGLAVRIEAACRAGANDEACRLATGLDDAVARGIAALKRASGLPA
jgi:HPt (histidine-containing phosphotransfer) domain-containing protein